MGVLESTYNAGVGIALLPARGALAALSGVAELDRRAGGPLGAATDRHVLSSVDLVLDRLLSDDVIERVMGEVERRGIAQRVVDRLLDDGIAEAIAERVLSGP